MFSIPPLPGWNGVHPILVHVPIALVFVVPLFVVMSLLLPAHRRVLLASAAGLMCIAAIGAVLAANSGEAGEGNAERVPGVQSVLHEHEELGEAAEMFTLGLAGGLVVLAGASWWGVDRLKRPVVALGIVYLAAHAVGTLCVANAAHQGGRLVHELGVRAWAGAGGPAASPPPLHDADD